MVDPYWALYISEEHFDAVSIYEVWDDTQSWKSKSWLPYSYPLSSYFLDFIPLMVLDWICYRETVKTLYKQWNCFFNRWQTHKFVAWQPVQLHGSRFNTQTENWKPTLTDSTRPGRGFVYCTICPWIYHLRSRTVVPCFSLPSSHKFSVDQCSPMHQLPNLLTRLYGSLNTLALWQPPPNILTPVCPSRRRQLSVLLFL